MQLLAKATIKSILMMIVSVVPRYEEQKIEEAPI